MTPGRDAFLQRVRQAVAAGNRPGQGGTPEPRGRIGYQGAGPDPLARFCRELQAAGGQAHVVADAASAAAKVVELVQACSARRILVGGGPVLPLLKLGERLQQSGVEIVSTDSVHANHAREPLFQADVGISGVDYLVAETGSIIALSQATEPRSLSLLPPVHIAVAERAQLLPDLFDLFEALKRAGHRNMPACLTVITGPSKTGDIELRLVTGVHGPGEVHVILFTGGGG